MKLSDNEVIYLDNHLLIVDKPPLLLTQPAGDESDSVQTRGAEWIKEKFGKPGNVFLHPVHRLDRVASGIVVCARTSKSLKRLNEQIRNGDWKKLYRLRYEGDLPALKGTLRHFLEKGDYHTKVSSKGQEAILHYKQIEKGLAEVELITGRYHQIRAQFAAIGCPICGDYKYGAKTKAVTAGIDLTHIRLEFHHPVTHESVQVHAAERFH
jgi:23S rRNA pseudouridine1911/1915/1917 synthase